MTTYCCSMIKYCPSFGQIWLLFNDRLLTIGSNSFDYGHPVMLLEKTVLPLSSNYYYYSDVVQHCLCYSYCYDSAETCHRCFNFFDCPVYFCFNSKKNCHYHYLQKLQEDHHHASSIRSYSWHLAYHFSCVSSSAWRHSISQKSHSYQ